MVLNVIKLHVGKEGKQLSYTITPKFFGKMGIAKWSTSNGNVVTINQTGEITPVNAGTANIYLTLNNSQAVCSVTVEEQYLKGDVNKDGKITIYDVIQILNQSILGGDLTDDMLYIMDYNEDEKVTIYDAIQFLNEVILG